MSEETYNLLSFEQQLGDTIAENIGKYFTTRVGVATCVPSFYTIHHAVIT
jgi:hypothetical protein